MSVSILLKIFAGFYLVAILTDAIQSRKLIRFLLELLPLAGLTIIDLIINYEEVGYVTFGSGSSPVFVILIMLVSILFGTMARYIFYLRGAFSWLDFAKPLCISPLLLIPLVGSVQGTKDLGPIQIISFALLAFQNGFFWQTVLQKSRPKK